MENAADCLRHNVRVHVIEVNPSQSVAICSVEQLHRGLMRMKVPDQQLIWHAEQALVPLMNLGISPMITVRQKSLKNLSKPTARRATPSLMDLIRDLWGRLGTPLSREGFSVLPVAHDPFGWQQAMLRSTGR